MSEMIKVEHEDELLTAECPAFYVMGVGHGHLDGDRITTYTLLANQKLCDEYNNCFIKWLDEEEPHSGDIDIIAFCDKMKSLVVEGYCPGRTGQRCTVSSLASSPNIFVVIHKKPEK